MPQRCELTPDTLGLVVHEVAGRFGPPKGPVPSRWQGSGVIASKTIAAGALRTSSGSISLWAAPTIQGGHCTLLEADVSPRVGKPTLVGNCDIYPRDSISGDFQAIYAGGHPHKLLLSVFYGYAGPGIASVTARFGSHPAESITLRAHYFLIRVPGNARDVVLTALGRRRQTVAGLLVSDRSIKLIPGNTWSLPTGKQARDVRCARIVIPPDGTQLICWPWPKPAEIEVSPSGLGSTMTPQPWRVLSGPVGSRIASLELGFQDGTTRQLPLADHFTLYKIQPANFTPGHKPSTLIGRDNGGNIIARAAVPSKWAPPARHP